MPTITLEKLKVAIQQKLQQADVLPEHAAIVADVLTFAEMRGVQSHGVIRLPLYLRRIAQGHINIRPDIQVTYLNDAVCKINGDFAFGHVVAKRATDEAVALAKKSGIGLAVVSNSTHCGAVGYYAHQAAKEGMISLLLTQADALVAPFGGRDAYLGVNPITYGVPNADAEPIVLDMSTSNAAFGKVMVAREQNTEIPPTWGLDADGNPTTNPHEVKALQAIAGAKGSGLALFIDVVAGLLPGGNDTMYNDLSQNRQLGQFIIAINPALFMEPATFEKGIQNMVKGLHEAVPAPGFKQVQLPGERSAEKAQKAQQLGVRISESAYDLLKEELE